MEEKISVIKSHFQAASLDRLPELISAYEADERSGVQSLIAAANKKLEALEKEKQRTENLKKFEKEYAAYGYLCGIDEVGRGPLAGPVVAGAVVLPKDCDILYLNDSKQLSEKKREELYDVIMEKAVSVGLGFSSPERIDEINILQATYEAMKQVPIIKGDAKSVSIAAASIVAKVTRDRMMVEYDTVFPEYGFASNKGYGAAAHIEALKKYGPCPIHRRSFITHFV